MILHFYNSSSAGPGEAFLNVYWMVFLLADLY